MKDEITVDVVRADELPELLALYRHLNPDDPELPLDADLERLWAEMQADPRNHYLAGRVDGRLVSTGNLLLIPNLTRGARPYGLIENVVTHPDFRGRGIGTRVLRHALSLAWEHGCYKVMLLTSKTDEGLFRFYEQAGFRRGIKTGFLARPE